MCQEHVELWEGCSCSKREFKPCKAYKDEQKRVRSSCLGCLFGPRKVCNLRPKTDIHSGPCSPQCPERERKRRERAVRQAEAQRAARRYGFRGETARDSIYEPHVNAMTHNFLPPDLNSGPREGGRGWPPIPPKEWGRGPTSTRRVERARALAPRPSRERHLNASRSRRSAAPAQDSHCGEASLTHAVEPIMFHYARIPIEGTGRPVSPVSIGLMRENIVSAVSIDDDFPHYFSRAHTRASNYNTDYNVY